MEKFKKIAIEVNAVQWRGDNRTEIELFVGKRLKTTAVPHQMERELDNIPHEAYTIEIPTREGMQTAVRNDWIIQGHSNEYGYHFWVNKPDYFRKAYEPVEDQDTSAEPAAETEKKPDKVKFTFDPNAGEGILGVCGNCLNGAHNICDNEHCKCKDKGHKPWWWVHKNPPSLQQEAENNNNNTPKSI